MKKMKTPNIIISIAILLLFQSSPTLAIKINQIEIKSGIWKGDGNAQIWVIQDGKYQLYDFTSVSCIASANGEAKDLVEKIFPKVEAWTNEKFVVSYYDGRSTFRRITELPQYCQIKRDSNDPFYNFDTFWQYFKENYPSFKLRGIDWEGMRQIYRSRIKASMSENELYGVLGEMIEKINDPHVFVTNGKQGAENISFGSPDPHGLAAAVRKANPGKTTNEYRDAADKIKLAIETEIRYELLNGKFKTAQNDRLIWGMLTPDVGYLRNSQSFGLFKPGLTREQMYAELEATLNKIFADFKNAKSLIIDITTNTGGAHFVTDFIARRLIQKPIIGYYARTKTPTGFDEQFTKILEPANGPHFFGPVIILISSNTVSAGEALPLVLHGLSNVTLYGETTLGATGSFTMLSLPNGGKVAVANDVFTDRNGIWYEKKGIAPDVQAIVFNPKKLVSGYLDFVNSAKKLAKSKLKKDQ